MKIDKSWCQRGPSADWCAYATIYGNSGCSCCTTRLELRWSPTRFCLGFAASFGRDHIEILIALWGSIDFIYNGMEGK